MTEATQEERWALLEMLADMRREFPRVYRLPRAWGSLVLITVGDNLALGEEDLGYSAREIGWALVKLFGAYDDKAFGELARAYTAAQAFYAEASVPTDLPDAGAGEVLTAAGDYIAHGESHFNFTTSMIGWSLASAFGANEMAFRDIARGYAEALTYVLDGVLPVELRQ